MPRSFGVLVALAVAGCVAPRVDRSGSAIIGGEASTADDDAAIGLAMFSGGGFSGACSGVLVAPNLVLTARHCVSNTQAGGLACDDAGDPIAGGKVLTDHRATDLSVLVGPDLTFEFAAKGKTIIHNDATNLCNNDLALVVLDTAIEGAKIAKIRLETPPVVGEMVDAVGWGVSDNSQGYGRRKRSNIPIMAVGPAWPDDIGGVGPREFATGEGICQGDSGGPVFDHQTGAVVGIVSRGGNGKQQMQGDPAYISCVDDGKFVARNFYMRTDGFKELILQGFAEAGTDPWEENGPDPKLTKDGETCGAAAECRSNLCMSGACTKRCDKDGVECPEGTMCTDVDGVLACVTPKMVKKAGCQFSTGAQPGGPALLIVLLGLALLLVRRRDV
jgi:MYXO-CTERM domain-containing protein